DAVAALLSGTVQLSSGTLAPAQQHIKSGALRALAVTTTKRWHDLPEIPTMLEAGYPEFVFDTYTALMAPAQTPTEIVSRIENESLAILQQPDLLAEREQSGFDVTAKTGKEHMERVTKEVAMFQDIIENAGIKKLQ